MDYGIRSQQQYTKILLVIVILILAAFLLTPRYWEPGAGGESWKQWAAARILRDTGEFPVIGLGPLYIIYLQLFSFFDYPMSMYLEHIVTHLFTYLAIYFMLQKFIRSEYALLLTIAWIPRIAVVEMGSAVAGIGLLSLYLMRAKDTIRNEEYFPLTLSAAALVHSTYIPFLAGHIIGVSIKKYKKHKPLIDFSNISKKVGVLLIKLGFIILILLTAVFPPTHYNNHGMIDLTYAPAQSKDPFSLVFFMRGNAWHIMRNFPEEDWINQDWYFTQEEAFGGATNVFQAVYNNPETVIKNILTTIRLGIQVPAYFFIGTFPGIISLIFWILPILGFIGLFCRLKAHNNIPLIFSIGIGTLAIFGSLLLTAFLTRYLMVLLPVALLTFSHVGLGLYYLRKSRLSLFSRFNSISIAVKSTRFLIIISFILLLLTVQYPAGKKGQIEAVIENKAFFSGKQPVSMVNTHTELLKSVDKDSKVLALEHSWVMAFTNVDLDNTYQVWSLPPFPDPSGETEKMLSNLDVILVSNKWEEERATLPTQSYLRYILHVKPFLEKAVNEGWTVKNIKGYGKVYKKAYT